MAKARRAADLTGDQMAERLSARLGKTISKQTVSNWENDHNQPRNMLAVLDAWAAECPPEYTREWLLSSSCFSVIPGAGDGQLALRFERHLATV